MSLAKSPSKDAIQTGCSPEDARDQVFPGLNDKMVAQGAIYDCVVEYILWFNHCVYLLDAPNALQRLLIVAEHGNLMRRDYRGAFLLRASTRR